MSVRKRVWRNADGSQGEAWAVSYTDQDGRRRLKSFKLKRDADAYHASVATDLRSGLHVPDATSIMLPRLGAISSIERRIIRQASDHDPGGLPNLPLMMPVHVFREMKLARRRCPVPSCSAGRPKRAAGVAGP